MIVRIQHGSIKFFFLKKWPKATQRLPPSCAVKLWQKLLQRKVKLCYGNEAQTKPQTIWIVQSDILTVLGTCKSYAKLQYLCVVLFIIMMTLQTLWPLLILTITVLLHLLFSSDKKLHGIENVFFFSPFKCNPRTQINLLIASLKRCRKAGSFEYNIPYIWEYYFFALRGAESNFGWKCSYPEPIFWRFWPHFWVLYI